MTTKVNSGVFKNQSAEGSLRFYHIAGTGIAADIQGAAGGTTEYFFANGESKVFGENEPVPGSALEIAMRVIEDRATILIMENADANLVSFCLATATAWGHTDAAGDVADLNAEIQALGVVAVTTATAPGTFDFSTVTVTETIFALDAAAVPATTPRALYQRYSD